MTDWLFLKMLQITYNSYQMSENTAANDYALAKILNERVINIFAMVIDHRSTPDPSDVNRSYVLLIDELKRIYDRQPELKKLGGGICWRVLDNLEQAHEFVPVIEFTHSGGDYGEEHNSKVSRLCIIANIDKPVLTPQIEKLLNEADNNIKAFQYELDKMNAKLSFEKMTIPVISIGNSTYHLSSMRYGITFDIISYCFDNSPNEYVGLTTINKYLQLDKLGKPNIKNLRDKMRGSHFEDEGPLVPFIEISPRKIMIKKSAALTDEQVNKIKAVSKHSNSD